jgi:hypothetical protein
MAGLDWISKNLASNIIFAIGLCDPVHDIIQKCQFSPL